MVPWTEATALGSRNAEISRDIWRDLGLTGMMCWHQLFPSRMNKTVHHSGGIVSNFLVFSTLSARVAAVCAALSPGSLP